MPRRSTRLAHSASVESLNFNSTIASDVKCPVSTTNLHYREERAVRKIPLGSKAKKKQMRRLNILEVLLHFYTTKHFITLIFHSLVKEE